MAPGDVQVRAFALTDPGRVRESNEDYVLFGDLDAAEAWDVSSPVEHILGARGPLFVVCDGMGGAAAGEVASELACKVVWQEMRHAHPTVEREVYARLLRRAVRVANRRVFEEGRREPGLRGMGTTLSAVGMVGTALVVAQVGDSRAYVQRGEALVQVTRDQSIVSALVSAGRITAEEARRSGKAHMILQALGVRDDLEVSLSLVELRRGDRVLLCTDGLYGPLGDEVLRSVLSSREETRAAADLLVSSARAAGGPDNITAVVVDFAGEGLAPPGGDDDLPRFVEIDPSEEGARALATTSRVARRLAARAGLVEDAGPPALPATGQHDVIRTNPPRPSADVGEIPGPATRRLSEQQRLGLLAWLVAGAVGLAVAAALLWDLL